MRDVDIVGDDQQPLMMDKMTRDLLGRRPDIDEERGIVRDLGRGPAADTLLLGVGKDTPPATDFLYIRVPSTLETSQGELASADAR